jgi:integrase
MIGHIIPGSPTVGCGSGKEAEMAVFRRGQKWYYDLSATISPTGRRIKVVIPTARTKAEVLAAEREALRKIHEGVYGKPTQGAMLLRDYVDRNYLPWAKLNKRSWKIDTSRLKPVVDFFGHRKLRDISPFLIESFKSTRLKTAIRYKTKTKPRSVASVNREFFLLSKIFSRAVIDKEVAQNPCRDVKALSGEENRIRYLSLEEEKRLMSVLIGDREHLRNMVILDINTGLRQDELLSLKLRDIDLQRSLLNVCKSKNGDGRDVPLNNTAHGLLSCLVEQARRNDDEYIFTNPQSQTRFTTIKTAWGTACEKAGITNLRFHDLRHTFGTRAIDNGAPLSAVQKIMGHKTIQTTMQYVHATDEGKRRAVQAVEAAGKLVPIWSQKSARKTG